MPIERPTFHESWYRVAELHPKIRSTVQITRQHFRGLPWHVVQDHTNNAFFRLAEPAYRFIGLLDGVRTVETAWVMVNEQLGDEAPTQGEVIQLLGQLYTANLLQAEVPADTHTLFARYKKRKQREISSYLMNIMFARMPLFDPDAFLNRWLSVLGWIFSPVGLIVWVVMLGFGLQAVSQVPGWTDKFTDQAGGLLSPDNLILLYVAFAVIKACHEMGHAIACKKFGKQSGTGGEVHVIGIMLLVFTPVPYVDASSSWALKNKWHRAIVGAAGMWVELAIASMAAVVWANTKETSAVHAFTYNVMFVASFSTVVFNANPLLRYDGYYILSDLLEIPNLAQRSKDYIFYLVKKYVWNVRFARNPAHGRGEKGWLFVYAIASFVMRVIVSFSILFYLASVLDGTLIILAAGMAIAGLFTWVAMPVGKFLHYLATSTELSRVRARAIWSSFAATALVVGAVGFFPAPHHERAQGVVEPIVMAELFPGGDGLVTELGVNPAGAAREVGGKKTIATLLGVPEVTQGQVLVKARNVYLEAERQSLAAEWKKIDVQRKGAMAEDPAKAQGLRRQQAGLEEQITAKDLQLAELELKSPLTGVYIAPGLETQRFGFIKRSEAVGMVADLRHLMVRAATANELGGMLDESVTQVEIRVEGRPDILLTGQIAERIPAGTNQLPSAALGYQVGGSLSTATDDRQGTKTQENFFEVRIDRLKLVKAPTDVKAMFEQTGQIPLLPGQRVVVRFDLAPKPLATQGWTMLLQLFQKKFQM